MRTSRRAGDVSPLMRSATRHHLHVDTGRPHASKYLSDNHSSQCLDTPLLIILVIFCPFSFNEHLCAFSPLHAEPCSQASPFDV